MLKLFLLEISDYGYDEYDSFVVVSESEELARTYHPSWRAANWSSTCNTITVTEIGIANEKFSEGDKIITSFNAG